MPQCTASDVAPPHGDANRDAQDPIHAAPAAGVPVPGTLRASCALGRFAACLAGLMSAPCLTDTMSREPASLSNLSGEPTASAGAPGGDGRSAQE